MTASKKPNLASPRRKQSISTITNILLVVFIGLIVLMVSFTYNQLKQTETSFKKIAIEVLPTLANNGIIHSQLSSLAFLVANFAQSNSLAQMRISRAEVTDKLQEIERLIGTSSIAIDNDLKLIRTEFKLLDAMIQEVFALQKILNEGETQLYTIRSTIQDSDSTKRYEITELLLLALKLIHAEKLIDVRKLQRSMEAQLTGITESTDSTLDINTLISEKINQLVFGEQGIIASKLLVLRTRGRVEGQRNFVRRLVLDIASATEFKAYEFADSQSVQAELLARRTSEQFSITLIAHLVTFLIGLAVIVFVRMRVVTRLEALTQSLSHKTLPDNIERLYRQNDEISALAKTVAEHINTIDEQKAELTQLSFMDSLTKVGNRRAFNQKFQQALNLAMRNRLTLSVLLIDVDSFKQFNDEFGHVKGDECLFQVAQLLNNRAKRSSDFVARYGGEEFVCLLIGMPPDDALAFAKQLCVLVEALAIPHTLNSASVDVVTVSIGVYSETTINAQSGERLLQCADTALYQAKTSGRNQAVQYLS